jgi:hypothetical protein
VVQRSLYLKGDHERSITTRMSVHGRSVGRSVGRSYNNEPLIRKEAVEEGHESYFGHSSVQRLFAVFPFQDNVTIQCQYYTHIHQACLARCILLYCCRPFDSILLHGIVGDSVLPARLSINVDLIETYADLLF